MKKAPHLGMIIGYRLTAEELAQNPTINNNLQVAPAITNAVWPGEFGEGVENIGVNCTVFLDGGKTLSKTSIKFGTEKGQYFEIDENEFVAK